MVKHRLTCKFAGMLLLAAVLNAGTNLSVKADTGQQIDDSSGGLFMEEVVDPEEQRKQQEELNRKSAINRRRLSDEELRNIGVQMSPSGSIVPIIKRGAPPVQQQGSTIQSYNELPYGYTLAVPTPLNPYTGLPGIIPGPYQNSALYNPFGYPGFGYPGFRYPGFGYPSYPYPSYPYPGQFGQRGFVTGFGSIPTTTLENFGSQSFDLAGGGTQITTKGTISRSPFWNGVFGRTPGPGGRYFGGGSFSLPTETEFESTTTFQPIAPHFATDD